MKTTDYPHAPLPPGWRLLRLGQFIRTGDRMLNVFENAWLPSEFTTKNRMRVGSVKRINDQPAPYIRYAGSCHGCDHTLPANGVCKNHS
jgi:hypothetical protein